jgi:hypothetical protein
MAPDFILDRLKPSAAKAVGSVCLSSLLGDWMPQAELNKKSKFFQEDYIYENNN